MKLQRSAKHQLRFGKSSTKFDTTILWDTLVQSVRSSKLNFKTTAVSGQDVDVGHDPTAR